MGKIVMIKFETAKAALDVFDILKNLAKDYINAPCKKTIDQHYDELKQAIEKEIEE